VIAPKHNDAHDTAGQGERVGRKTRTRVACLMVFDRHLLVQKRDSKGSPKEYVWEWERERGGDMADNINNFMEMAVRYTKISQRSV
jgi:hypothetical protein